MPPGACCVWQGQSAAGCLKRDTWTVARLHTLSPHELCHTAGSSWLDAFKAHLSPVSQQASQSKLGAVETLIHDFGEVCLPPADWPKSQAQQLLLRRVQAEKLIFPLKESYVALGWQLSSRRTFWTASATTCCRVFRVVTVEAACCSEACKLRPSKLHLSC